MGAEEAAGYTSLAVGGEDIGIIRVERVFVLIDSLNNLIRTVCLCPF